MIFNGTNYDMLANILRFYLRDPRTAALPEQRAFAERLLKQVTR